MIGIILEGDDFTSLWITELNKKRHDFIVLSIYDKDFLAQARNCKAVFWHFSHTRQFDIKWSRIILEALSSRGIKTFPNHAQSWHFDNKIAQYFLLNDLGYKLPKTTIYLRGAEIWSDLNSVSLPVVMKFYGGAGSQNVIKIRTKIALFFWAFQAFTIGIAHHRPIANFILHMKRPGRNPIVLFFKDILKYVLPSKTERVFLREKSYFYLQEFIPNAEYDIRIITIGDKAFGIKRYTGARDFRASGSGIIDHDIDSLPKVCVRNSFEISERFNYPWMTYDWIYDKDKAEYLLVEISYGFKPAAYTECNGYFSRDIEIKKPMFNIYSEMIDVALR